MQLSLESSQRSTTGRSEGGVAKGNGGGSRGGGGGVIEINDNDGIHGSEVVIDMCSDDDGVGRKTKGGTGEKKEETKNKDDTEEEEQQMTLEAIRQARLKRFACAD